MESIIHMDEGDSEGGIHMDEGDSEGGVHTDEGEEEGGIHTEEQGGSWKHRRSYQKTESIRKGCRQTVSQNAGRLCTFYQEQGTSHQVEQVS